MVEFAVRYHNQFCIYLFSGNNFLVSTNQSYVNNGDVIEIRCQADGHTGMLTLNYNEVIIITCILHNGEGTASPDNFTLVFCSDDCFSQCTELYVIVRLDIMTDNKGDWLCIKDNIGDQTQATIWKHSE